MGTRGRRTARTTAAMLGAVVVLTGGLVAGATGCSGTKAAAPSTTAKRPVATTVAPPPSESMSPSKVLAADLQYSTFAKVVRRSGLTKRLDAATRLTIFAPTDAAFARLSKRARTAALNDPEAAGTLVERHVVGATLDLNALVNRTAPLRTWGGDRLKVVFDPATKTDRPGTLALTVGGAPVTSVQVPFDAGFLHVVDRVVPVPA